jgi:hypothetical protein
MAYNSFATPNLGGYSPFYLVFLRDPTDISGLTFTLDVGLSSSYQECHTSNI